MKKNKTAVTENLAIQNQETNAAATENDGMFRNGLWMEFDDSFIQILAGYEPNRTYYYPAEAHQQQISC